MSILWILWNVSYILLLSHYNIWFSKLSTHIMKATNTFSFLYKLFREICDSIVLSMIRFPEFLQIEQELILEDCREDSGSGMPVDNFLKELPWYDRLHTEGCPKTTLGSAIVIVVKRLNSSSVSKIKASNMIGASTSTAKRVILKYGSSIKKQLSLLLSLQSC